MKEFKIKEKRATTRMGHLPVEGGGLNASYTTVDAIGGQWINKTTDDFFGGKRVDLFSLPGAFTPTCSSQQLPGFEKEYDAIKTMGID